VEIWQAPPNCYLGGEPAFAPDPSGGGGWVICQQLDAEVGESAFLIFDAFDVGRGPVAKLASASPMHLGFHAFFLPA
jgi:carotenoid cleavage dioxygenase-like enzyme